MSSIAKNFSFDRLANAQAAGTGAVNSDSVDMQGYQGVIFFVVYGALASTATADANLAGSSDDSTFTDLTGSSVTVADTDDNKVAFLEVFDPLSRYIRCEVDRQTANTTIDAIFAFRYCGTKKPATNASEILTLSVVRGV